MSFIPTLFARFASLIADISSDISSEGSSGDNVCGPHYSKTTLKTSASHPLISMFQDTKGAKKYEGSDVIFHNGSFLAICDSLWSILKIKPDMSEFGSENELIGEPFHSDGEESGYEGIFAVGEDLFVVRESIEMGEEGFHAVVEEVLLGDDGDYTLLRACPTDLEFDGDGKGFEGAVGFKAGDGETYMLGLCEGNFCKEGKEGKDKGNGRVVVMKRDEDACKVRRSEDRSDEKRVYN